MSKQIHGELSAKGLRFALIVSRFNSLVTEELLKGALDSLKRHGANLDDQLIIYVPGSWEIPLAAQCILQQGVYDGVIALGCVMQGETAHNDLINAEVSKGLGALQLQFGKPVGFGVLSPSSLEQALHRSGMKLGNKGAETALAVIETARVLTAMKTGVS